MYFKKQQGKGMIPFLAGSAVALIAITVMLLTLNRNSQTAFKQPELAQPQKPEILTPNNVPSAPQTTATTQPTVMENSSAPSVSNVATAPVASQPTVAAKTPVAPEVSDKEINKMFEDNMAMQGAGSEVATPVVKVKPQPKAMDVTKEKAKEVAKAKAAEKTVAKVEDVKPTAQQILDSGNIEKAREVARKEAQAKAQTAEKAKSKTTAATKETATRGAVSIQAGAYANKKAAEDQRAKLALMGVQTKVVPVTSGGKTVYRVQTSKLQGDKANQVKQTLQNNGINTYTHK
ncbi:SPOR domain-containing protein [Neisseriaceae bacterium B1]